MGYEELDEIAKRAHAGEAPTVPVRRLLEWFGAERRGSNVVTGIRKELRNRDLVTKPDFAEVWIDSEVAIEARPSPALLRVADSARSTYSTGAATSDDSKPAAQKEFDAVHRIALLDSANRGVTTVAPGAAISVAVTKMMIHDFSQLPVMQSPRNCRGAVSWKGIARQLALGNPLARVEDCLEPVITLDANESLLDAIPKVVAAGFVLVRGAEDRVTGIITTADLSVQFQTLSQPFILLGQIENLLRGQIQRSFSIDELKAAKNPIDSKRTVEDATGLTFGECVRLLEQELNWKKLSVAVDQREFLDCLRRVHAIRNEVMHFHPDPLERDEVEMLRNFAKFLEFVAPN